MRINSINFGMKFTPNTEKLINSAKNDCINTKQENECQKCISFLKTIFPDKTLDIKTEFHKPKGLFEKLFGKNGYYDRAYIDGKPDVYAKINPVICDEKITDEGVMFVSGIFLPVQDTEVTYRRETNLERLIAISNSILVTKFADSSRFSFVPNNKFLGRG